MSEFDVFLSHNSQDKPTVRELAQALKSRGLRVWLDEEQLVPGRPWQEALEMSIQTTHSAAVLIGRDGLGPWEDVEMRACLSEFVSRKLPVIPVLLPAAPSQPELPLFLKAMTWVDLRGGFTEDGLNRLQWGITGVRPQTSAEVLPPANAPKVFIAATLADLQTYCERAKVAAQRAGFVPVIEEKDAPPLADCLAKVDAAQLAIAIVAYRYGWVPDGTKSIQWRQCEHAVNHGKALQVFLVDELADWPVEKREEFRLTQAAQEGRFQDLPQLAQEIERNTRTLKEFKTWLTERHIRNTFANPEELGNKIESALRDWLDAHPEFEPQAKAHARAQVSPERYLSHIYDDCGHIDIRGLQVGSGRAHRFPIEDLYIELETRGGGQLKNTLNHPRRIVIGDPGAGKTTFLRWIAHILAGDCLGLTDNAASTKLGIGKRLLPAFVSIADWLQHIQATQAQPGRPTTSKDPQWLVDYLAEQAGSHDLGLDKAWFQQQLQQGRFMLLFDGLDEAPDETSRARAAALIEAVANTWKDCTILATSRPAGYEDRAVLPGFASSQIESLGEQSVQTFLERWSDALFPGKPEAAQNHRQELGKALNARPGIRRLARNTVMLTALAVVHWNEKRLPEQRAELYESILRWLARSREDKPNRAKPERCLELLRRLALAMFTADGGRKVQVSRRWAAEQLKSEFNSLEIAERFLEEEELDSGIIVRRGNEIRFWHLSFQEYLAARAIAGMDDEDQHKLLLDPPRRFYQPEWREVVLLLAGVLYAQGREKVDNLFDAVLERLGDNASLIDQARATGLLLGIVRDLAPFDYQPKNQTAFQNLITATLGIFDREKSKTVPVKRRVEAAEALGQAGDPRLADESRYWVEIPGGSFWMGAQNDDPQARNYDPGARDNETPHEVEVDGFQMGRYPVTVQDYADFIDDEGYADGRWWSFGGFQQWQSPEDWEQQAEHPNRPVVGVSWFEAMAFCAWRTAHLSVMGKLSLGYTIRLPTEAEWEWAARGSM